MKKIQIEYINGHIEEYSLKNYYDDFYWIKDNLLNFFYISDGKQHEKYINILNIKEFDVYETGDKQ